jgi:histidine triad (HIT) family protein
VVAVVDRCIFCAIVSESASAERVYDDDTTLAFLDINPATRGHTLVVPKRHARDLSDVEVPDLQAMAAAGCRVAGAAVGSLGAAGVNFFLSSGNEAFQTVFHIHLHVIPRYSGDAVRLPWIPKPGNPDVIAEAGRSLRAALG